MAQCWQHSFIRNKVLATLLEAYRYENSESGTVLSAQC